MKKIVLFWLGLAVTGWSFYPIGVEARESRTSYDDVHVDGYYRSNGTYVKPHYRSAPDGIVSNNYGCLDRGNCGQLNTNLYKGSNSNLASGASILNTNTSGQNLLNPFAINFRKEHTYQILISITKKYQIGSNPKIYSTTEIGGDYDFIERSECNFSDGYHVVPVSIVYRYTQSLEGYLCEKSMKNGNNYRVYSSAGGGNLRKNPFIGENIVNFLENNEVVHVIDEKIHNKEPWVLVITKNMGQGWIHKPLLKNIY